MRFGCTIRTTSTARGLATEYLWGRDLLIAPVFQNGATTRDVYLPKGDWYDWWTNARVAGARTVARSVDLATMPIYVRAGAIIPFDPIRQYTSEPVTDPTTLRVYRGANGTYTLYEDDGASQDYLEGKATWTRMTWNDRERQLTIEPWRPPGTAIGPTDAASRVFNVVMYPDGTSKQVTYEGRLTTVAFR